MLIADALRVERDTLRREIAGLEAKQKRLSLVLELLKFYEKPEAESRSEPFAGMAVSEAILAYLITREEQSATVTEIRDALLAGGIVSGAERFDTVIHVECRRLMIRKKLVRIRDDMKTIYKLCPAAAQPSVAPNGEQALR